MEQGAIASSAAAALLGPDDPSPVVMHNPQGRSPFLLIGDHAGNGIPFQLGDLGVSETERTRHIGWDIGIAGLGRRLADAIDACFISQHYSRLVIDCNRDPAAETAIVPMSDGTAVPANAQLSAAERAARVDGIHRPYQEAIAARLFEMHAMGVSPRLIALHSFTPRMNGFDRPWQIGILHHLGDTSLARAVLARLQADPALVVGDNEPYQMDGTDYSVPHHAYAARLPYVEFEVRQDLIADAAGQQHWAGVIERVLRAAETDIR